MNHSFKIKKNSAATTKAKQQQQKQKQALALYSKKVDFNLEGNSLRLIEFFISSFIELKILGPSNRRENFRTFALQEGRQKKFYFWYYSCEFLVQ